MEPIIKTVAKDSANWAINSGSPSNETNIKVTTEIAQLFGKVPSNDEKYDVLFYIFKEDFVKSLCCIFGRLPLAKSRTGKLVNFSQTLFVEDMKAIEDFFGQEDKKQIKALLAKPVSHSLCLNFGLGNFPIREFLLEKHSKLVFSKDDKTGDISVHIVFEPKIDTDISSCSDIATDLKHQQIFYGAPGTGKSHATNEVTSQYPDTVRTTFHPDSDYSTFVGAYKPTMEEVEVKTIPVVVAGGITLDQNNGTYKEKKITYKFIKQAFLKAYVKAWRNFAKTSPRVSHKPISFTTKFGSYIITSINNNNIIVYKTEPINKDVVKNKWNNEWENSNFNAANIKSHSIAKAICQWIYDNISQANKDSFDEGWHDFLEQTKKGLIDYKAFSQTYSFKLDNDQIFVTSSQNSNKDTIRESFETNCEKESTADGIAKKLKEYDSTDFDNAWEQISHAISNPVTYYPQFLVIEEINRGNCAQIFGDLFQLLDRKNGFSEYPIEADDDIRKALQEKNPDDGLSFADLAFSDEQKTIINSNFSNPNVADKIVSGELLVFPPNLHIWATMNTSDQSLFPIDSAFKRRWDWKYVPIDTTKESWDIEVNNKKYSWTSFLNNINEKIFAKTDSEDKQLGFYFCKADNNVIDAEKFVSKVLFYIYNDVYKDFGFDEDFFNDKSENKKLTFHSYFNVDGTVNEDKVAVFLNNLQIEGSEIHNETNTDTSLS